MDYEKLYKEALEIAKKELQACGSTDCDAARQIFRFFPELKESEDEKNEKVRIGLIKAFNTVGKSKWGGLNVQDILAWLEKQGIVIKDTISMDVDSETEWDDIHKFLRMNLDGEKVKLLIIRGGE